MQSFTPTAWLFMITVSFMIAVVSLWLLSLWSRQKIRPAGIPAEETAVFLFDDTELIDVTPVAQRLLDNGPDCIDDWNRFLAIFLPRFPNLQKVLGQAGGVDSSILAAGDSADHTRLEVRRWRGLTRISLLPERQGNQEETLDQVSLAALENELCVLRQTAEQAPFPAWKVDDSGQIVWANRAYLTLLERLYPTDDSTRAWPPRLLFPPANLMSEAVDNRARRYAIKAPQLKEGRLWFECYSKRVKGGILQFATEADSIVRAETSLRNFIQTLSLTFAHLPTGLAIFDRKRQLTLFNPALTDLLSLPIDFLSSRPTLNAFLNLLREKRMIPEPKDYKSWCLQMEDLEAKAENGTYEEIWNLPGGQTYRIVGRPHPDGAVAFLFEDISAEMSLTRRFRSQLEIGQAVVDSFNEAVAVFSTAGVLIYSNTAYAELWGVDPESVFGEMTFSDAVGHWKALCDPSPVWDAAQQFLGRYSDRVAMGKTVRMKDGRCLACRLAPLPGGASLIGFSDAVAAQPTDLQGQKEGALPVKS